LNSIVNGWDGKSTAEAETENRIFCCGCQAPLASWRLLPAKKLSSLGLVTRAERQCYPRMVDLCTPSAGIEDRTPLAVTAGLLLLWGQGVKLPLFDCWLSVAYGHDSASARASSQSQCNDSRRLLPAPRPPMRPRGAVERQRHRVSAR